MELKYIHTFLTIVAEGSFSRAAEKLNYTQSTITFQIGQLEQELASTLFEKVGRRMRLTKAGELLLPYAHEVAQAVDKMSLFQQELAACSGDLRIGVGETLLCYKLPPVLKEFHQLAPRARLFIRSMNCYEIRDELLAGGLDVGVFYDSVGGFLSQLRVSALGSCGLVLVASPETAAKFPDFTTPGQVLGVPFIINEKNCVFRQIFEAYLKAKDITLDRTIELWSIPTIKNLVKNDLGVSFLPRFAVQQELAEGSLRELATDLPAPSVNAVCGWHKNKWLSPLMRLFIDTAGQIAPPVCNC